jgi:hypothetical protein
VCGLVWSVSDGACVDWMACSAYAVSPVCKLCVPCWLCGVWFSCWGVLVLLASGVVVAGARAWWWILMWAASALWTWEGVQVFLWKRLSFLAFHIYHIVNKNLVKIVSDVELDIKAWRVSWMPSVSGGRLSVLIGGVKENHTALGRSQWKNKCASSSTAPHALQWSCRGSQGVLVMHRVVDLFSFGEYVA